MLKIFLVFSMIFITVCSVAKTSTELNSSPKKEVGGTGIETKKERVEIKLQQGQFGIYYALCFSHDGKYLSSTIEGIDNRFTTLIWELKSGKVIRTFSGILLSFSPDDKNVVLLTDLTMSGKKASILEIKDLANRESTLNRTFECVTRSETPAVYSPDGKYLAIIVSNKDFSEGIYGEHYFEKFSIFEASTGKCIETLGGDNKKINLIKYTPDGKYIVTLNDLYSERRWDIWDAETNKKIKTIYDSSKSSKESITAFSDILTPDNKYKITFTTGIEFSEISKPEIDKQPTDPWNDNYNIASKAFSYDKKYCAASFRFSSNHRNI